ncbi:MAG: response regulator [Sphingomonas fennica]
MADTKVLVVDDSLTMRALISGALERIPAVKVVGLADGAAEARGMVENLMPDVMTLDIEMPGMSGLDYLKEIMTTRPMPVIMFSTRTTAGAEDSVEALRLGAVDCFPKPKVASPKELDAIIAKLGKRIKAARKAELAKPRAAAPVAAPPLDWNGRLVVVGGDAASTQGLFAFLGGLPANCPPIVVVQHLDPGLAQSMADTLDKEVAPRVVVAAEGAAIEQGTVHLAPAGDAHVVVDGWPNGKLRFLARDPVAGERPSISLLFASAARAAGAEAVGVLLLPEGSEDGGNGLKAMLAAGGHVLSAAEAGGFVLQRNMASQPVPTEALAGTLLKLCGK